MRALTRFSPLLLLLCLAGCGQTGQLYLLLPDVTFPILAPPIGTHMEPVLALPGTTIAAPARATAPRPPAAATHPAPAAVTRPAAGTGPVR